MNNAVEQQPRRPHQHRRLVAADRTARLAATGPARLVRRRSRPGRAVQLHRRRSLRRPVQEPDRRRGRWPPCSSWPSRSGWPSAGTPCSPASGSTSPRTGPCCTPRCAIPTTSRSIVDGTNVVPLVHEELAEGVRLRRQGSQRRVARGHRQADRDRGQHRHRRLRPWSGDGLRGAAAVRAAGSDGALRLQHRPDRRGGEDRRSRPRDHACSSSPRRRSPPWRR